MHLSPTPRVALSIAAWLIVANVLCGARLSAAQTTTAPLPQTPAPASAPIAPAPRPFAITASMDVANVFMFRGIRQNTNGIVMWPAADFTILKPAPRGVVKGVGFAASTWNSLHTDDTGLDGPSGSLWYESDFAATFGVAFRGGVTLSTTYNLYTSPNDSFATAKEIMFELAIDDSPYLAKGALKPTVTFARELDTEPGVGQADDGEKAGTYFEIGIAPEYAARRATIAIPVKVGLSLSHYYELDGADTTFGFFSIGGLVTVPIGTATKAGAWNIHGSVELQRLGEATTAFNDGRRVCTIASIGVGFKY